MRGSGRIVWPYLMAQERGDDESARPDMAAVARALVMPRAWAACRWNFGR